jgi:hypothetical protein
MRIVVDSEQGVGYFEITQAEYELFQADWRVNVEQRPDFKAMTLDQLLAYRWPETDPRLVELQKGAVKMHAEARMSMALRPSHRTGIGPGPWLLGIDVRVIP